MKKILFIALVVFVMIVSISGCNQPKNNIDTIPQDEGGEKISTSIVDIKNYSFMPVLVTIKKGQTVTWTNSDNVIHTVKSITNEFDSGSIVPGSEYKYEFNIAGPYEYICTVHPSMPHGKITVT